MNFSSLGLSPVLLRALDAQGYTSATPIQAEAIPQVLAGRDLMASAPTGTGKTAAFVLPLLQHLFPSERENAPCGTRPRALVLTPTRELAAQVHASVRQCAKGLPLHSTTVFGGVRMQAQLKALQQGVDVLVATPGRLLDHLQRGTVDLRGIEMLVLDEADRMLDMGFLPALRKIVERLPRQRQTLLFSATFAGPIKDLAAQFMRNPTEVQVAKPNSVTATVSHRMHPVDAARKRELLLHVLGEDSRRQALVFSRTKHGADKLVRYLEGFGLSAAAIHGNKSQNRRTRTLRDFKRHKITVLVATDIAARGIDIEQLPLVINHDLPMVAEDYIHRIGRTGRAGASGLAISLVSQAEAGLLRDIRRLLTDPVEITPVPGFEPQQPVRVDARSRPAPKHRPNRNGNGGKRGKSHVHAHHKSRRANGGGHAATPKRGKGERRSRRRPA